MRINKFLAACGLGSRRKVEEIILAGRVTVNGAPVSDLSTFVEPGRDKVSVDGRAARLPEGPTYYLLHKPEGIMTTVRDPEGRSTVLELVPKRPRVFPVGRLDRDTSGALLLTDDGNLAHRILHPRYGVEKEYIAVVEGTITDDAVSALREGVLLDGERRPTAPATVDVLDRKNKRSRVRLVVHEGRNRQVRRMLEAVGYVVLQLRRERIGPVSLGDLDAGLFRPLTAEEVAQLRRNTARARARPARRVDARPRQGGASKPAYEGDSRQWRPRGSNPRPRGDSESRRAEAAGPRRPRAAEGRRAEAAGPRRSRTAEGRRAEAAGPRRPRAAEGPRAGDARPRRSKDAGPRRTPNSHTEHAKSRRGEHTKPRHAGDARPRRAGSAKPRHSGDTKHAVRRTRKTSAR